MKRIPITELPNYIGKKVKICGWIEDKRIVGKVMFLTIRQGLETIQVTLKKTGNEDLWRDVEEITRQSSVVIVGNVRKFGNKLEIIPESVKVVGLSKTPLPLDPSGRVPALLNTILDSRALSIRIPHIYAIFSIRSKVTNLIRDFFANTKGFIEIHTPKIIASGTEGGADLFPVEYFNRTAYLAQSPQLYKEQLMLGFDGVFEIAPYFRAEKSHTRKHLNEFISVDLEISFANYKDAMNVLEELVNYVLENIIETAQKEIQILGHRPPSPPGKIPILTYDDSLEILHKSGYEFEWGEDLDSDALRVISKEIGDFFFIIDWPWRSKPFYIKRKGDKLTESFDLMYREIELSSGGTREHNVDQLKKNLSDKGLDPSIFEFHTKFYNYGMPPHAGFGLGLDRFLLVITGRENIREVVLYPRDPERLEP
jgi:aspartyl-tRNA synthetase